MLKIFTQNKFLSHWVFTRSPSLDSLCDVFCTRINYYKPACEIISAEHAYTA